MYIKINKKPAAEQDILFGEGGSQQERSKCLLNVQKVTIIKPLQTINDLKALDPVSFPYAMVTGKTQDNDGYMGYFYKFDSDSVETENIPYVVISNHTLKGRWKTVRYAEDVIEKALNDLAKPLLEELIPPLAEEEVTKATNEIVPPQVDKILEEEVPAMVQKEVATALEEVYDRIDSDAVKVGSYNGSLNYKTNNYNFGFVKDPETDQLLIRLYMANQDTQESPLSGTETSNLNGVTIYSLLNTLQENSKYNRVMFDTKFRVKIDSFEVNKIIAFSTSNFQPKNDLKFTIYDSLGAVSSSFRVSFKSRINFSIYDVYYNDTIRVQSTGSYGQVYFPGFAFVMANNGGQISVGLRFVDKTHVSSILVECDGYDIDYSIVESTGLYRTFAIRNGGGTDIQDFDIIYNSIKTKALSTLESYDYYLFKNGFVMWSDALVLDSILYSENSLYGNASLNIDPDDKYLANVGVINGQDLVKSLKGQAPNIVGEDLHLVGYGNPSNPERSTTVYGVGGNYASGSSAYPNGLDRQWVGLSGCFQNGRYVQINVRFPNNPSTDYFNTRGLSMPYSLSKEFNASLSSPLYQDDVETIETARITTQYVVRKF